MILATAFLILCDNTLVILFNNTLVIILYKDPTKDIGIEFFVLGTKVIKDAL